MCVVYALPIIQRLSPILCLYDKFKKENKNDNFLINIIMALEVMTDIRVRQEIVFGRNSFQD